MEVLNTITILIKLDNESEFESTVTKNEYKDIKSLMENKTKCFFRIGDLITCETFNGVITSVDVL
jgi:hypothetical protein